MDFKGISFYTLTICFFTATMISYLTVNRITEAFEYSPDRPKNWKRRRAVWGAFAFVISFALLLTITAEF